MSNLVSQDIQSVADSIKKLQSLLQEREDLERRQTKLLLLKEATEAEVTNLKLKLAENKTTPETLDQDILVASTTFNKEVSEYEAQIAAFRDVINKAEADLEKTST